MYPLLTPHVLRMNGTNELKRCRAMHQKNRRLAPNTGKIQGKRRCRQILSVAMTTTATPPVINMLNLTRLRSPRDTTSEACVIENGRSSAKKCSSNSSKTRPISRTSRFRKISTAATSLNAISQSQASRSWLKQSRAARHPAHQNTTERIVHTITETRCVAGSYPPSRKPHGPKVKTISRPNCQCSMNATCKACIHEASMIP
jgi:hypothetical protein